MNNEVNNSNNNVPPMENNQVNNDVPPMTNNPVNNNIPDGNIMTEKKKSPVLAIVITILIIVAVALGAFLFLNQKKQSNLSPRDIFINGIDSVNKYFGSSFDKLDSEITILASSEHKITGNIDSNNYEFGPISTLLKKLEIDFRTNINEKEKYALVDLDLNYNNKNALKGSIILDDKDAYLSLGSLYDKFIKLDTSAITFVPDIDAEDLDTTKNSINELVDILKKNLKDEYFSKEEGKDDLKIFKMTLNVKEYFTNVLNDVKNNNNVNKFFQDTLNIDVDDFQSDLESIDDKNIIIEITLTKNNEFNKLVITIDEEQMVIEKDEELYNISITIDEKLTKIGTLEIRDNYLALKINYDGVILNMTLDDTDGSKYDINIKITCASDDYFCSESEMGLNIEEKDSKGTIKFKLDDKEEGFTLNITDEFKNSDKVIDKPDVSNYVELDDISEEEANNIMLNLTNNEALLEIIQDLGLNDMFSEENPDIPDYETSI